MLFEVCALQTYTLHSLDKELGKITTFYFDDHSWDIRYLRIDTGDWLPDRQILLSPHALGAINEAEQTIAVDLSSQQIEDSPVLKPNQPISQQFEKAYFAHYGWPSYGDGLPLEWDLEYWLQYTESAETCDSHLRSMQTVGEYEIQAREGCLGQIKDFIVDVASWSIRYLIVKTQTGGASKQVLISPAWIQSVSWKHSLIFVEHLGETIKQSPAYTDISQLTRQAENTLHAYYDRHGYWVDELAAQEHSLR